MKDIRIARPYAAAAFEYAREQHTEASWSQALRVLALVIDSLPIQQRLNSPRYSLQSIGELCVQTTAEWLSDEHKRFVAVLVQAKRLALLPTIAALYEGLLVEANDTIEVTVESAIPLSVEYQEKLARRLEKRWGKTPVLHVRVNPALVAGWRLYAGDNVMDGSTACQLTTLKERLTGELCN